MVAIQLAACEGDCDFTGARRLPMISQFESGMRRDELEELKEGVAVNWELIRADALEAPSGRGRVRLETVQAAPFRVMGEAGRVELSFVNDLLVQVLFLPDRYDVFLRVMNDRGGLSIVTGQHVERDGVRIVASDHSFNRSGGYVAWSDLALEQRCLKRSD